MMYANNNIGFLPPIFMWFVSNKKANDINKVYIAMLGRSASADELSKWTLAIYTENSANLDDLKNTISQSDEYIQYQAGTGVSTPVIPETKPAGAVLATAILVWLSSIV